MSRDSLGEKLEVLAVNYEEHRVGGNLLCGRCKSGQVYRRRGKLQVLVYCRSLGIHVPSDIVECNKFEHYKTMDLYDMKEIYTPVDPRQAINDNSYR